MLTRLCLRDYVLTERVEINWAPGFCVLTGPTGAGKSLLVGALALLAGGRGGSELIRPGAKTAEVEAVFSLTGNDVAKAWLDENGLLPDDEMLIVRRLIGGGERKSAAFVNGRQTPLAQAAEIVSLLMEICGQHAHYSLRKGTAQRDVLDAYAVADTAIVADCYRRWRRRVDAWQTAQAAEASNVDKRAVLTETLSELTALGFSADRWQRMNDTLTRTANLADLAAACERALAALEKEGGAQPAITAASRELAAMKQHASEFDNILATLSDAAGLLNDAARELSAYGETLVQEPEALADAERFVGECHQLARKYGLADAKRLGEFAADKQAQLDALVSPPDLRCMEREAQTAEKKLIAAATTLSQQRQQAAQALTSAVNRLLKKLAMSQAALSVALSPLSAVTAAGAEKVEFQISTRAGRAPGAIVDIASGGELSRLGLAIQIAAGEGAAAKRQSRTMSVFDEVDTGVSGKTAAVVGALLSELGKTRQVLCVTHLPQVAAFADSHWRVDGGDMAVTQLSPEERVEELAQMQSGAVVTDAARRHAEEMLARAAG